MVTAVTVTVFEPPAQPLQEKYPPDFLHLSFLFPIFAENLNRWAMTNLNQVHKEAMLRTMRIIEESEKSPMSSEDFAFVAIH